MNIKKKIQKFTCILALLSNILLPHQSMAGIEKLIKNVMPQGTMSNLSKGAIVQDQLSGHVIGGSVMLKSPPSEDLQPANIQLPSCKVGIPCSLQVDLRAGAFSFIKVAQLEKFFKDLTANVGAYATLMAIKTMCPQCENILTYLEQIQRSMNQFNINSCDVASAIAGGIASKLSKGAEQAKQSANVLSSTGADMAEIRAASKDDGKDGDQSHPELESLLGDNYNLVWKALKNKADNTEVGAKLKEKLMSISGTIIGKKNEEGGRSVIHKKSLVTKELVGELIGIESKGGEVELYGCDETEKCLNPKIIKTRLNRKDTIYGSIEDLLLSIIKKIKENKQDLNPEEENLISLSGMPLLTKIQIDLATMNEDSNLTVRDADFLQALCYDVLSTYLGKALRQTSEAVADMEYAQLVDTKVFDEFKNEITEVLHFLSSGKANAFRRLNAVEAAKQRMIQEISFFDQKFSEMASSNAISSQRD